MNLFRDSLQPRIRFIVTQQLNVNFPSSEQILAQFHYSVHSLQSILENLLAKRLSIFSYRF